MVRLVVSSAISPRLVLMKVVLWVEAERFNPTSLDVSHIHHLMAITATMVEEDPPCTFLQEVVSTIGATTMETAVAILRELKGPILPPTTTMEVVAGPVVDTMINGLTASIHLGLQEDTKVPVGERIEGSTPLLRIILRTHPNRTEDTLHRMLEIINPLGVLIRRRTTIQVIPGNTLPRQCHQNTIADLLPILMRGATPPNRMEAITLLVGQCPRPLIVVSRAEHRKRNNMGPLS
jgi:hypothetical protein